MAKISPNAMIALCAVLQSVVPPMTALRQWILRRRFRTVFTVITDVSLWIFTFLYQAIGIIMIVYTLKEKTLRKRFHTEPEVMVGLLTPNYLQASFASFLGYTTQLYCLKAAYLAYFLQLRENFSTSLQRFTIVVSVYSAVAYVTSIVLQLAYCLPIQRNWSLGPSYCSELTTVFGSTLQAWFNLSCDLGVLAISISCILSLSLRTKERRALWVVCFLGAISPVMCLARFVQVYKVARHPELNGLNVVRQIYTWGTFEVTFAHIAFCLPSLRVLVRRWIGPRGYSASDSKQCGSSKNPGNSVDTENEGELAQPGIGTKGRMSEERGKECNEAGVLELRDVGGWTTSECEGRDCTCV